MINVFYGCARKHRINLPGILISYNDIDARYGCNYTCDIRDVFSGKYLPGITLCDYDAVIFTPPCNYWSRANYRRETSIYALETKDLLLKCLHFCSLIGKPFLVENVCNQTFFRDLLPSYQFVVGNHTYWSNVLGSDDFIGVKFEKNQNKNFIARTKRDGNVNVDIVIKTFLNKVHEIYEFKNR